MSTNLKELRPVTAQPGRPLYQTVKDYVREAIDAGVFRPGEQMPSTKELSEKLSVSLVTAHRALQELVSSGVLYRAQGKGTFVHDRYLDRDRSISVCRIGVMLSQESSLCDYFHCQIMEGIRQAAGNLSADLIFLRNGDDIRNECNGYLHINPLPEEAESVAARLTKRQPLMVVGATAASRQICTVSVDHQDMARQGIEYLVGLGHSRIAYVGGSEQVGSNRDRWAGFCDACQARGLAPQEQHLVRAGTWKLEEQEQGKLIRMLSGPRRPTAVFAAGYDFALAVYSAVGTIGLRMPEDLTVLGVDDPPSAAYLAPALTTLREPLVQLGHAAVTALCDYLQCHNPTLQSRELRAELVVRRSSGPVAGR